MHQKISAPEFWYHKIKNKALQISKGSRHENRISSSKHVIHAILLSVESVIKVLYWEYGALIIPGQWKLRTAFESFEADQTVIVHEKTKGRVVLR